MTNASDRPAKLRLNPWDWIEEIRRSGEFEPETIAVLEQMHSGFEHFGNAFGDNEMMMDAMIHSFIYGSTVGSYLTVLDEAIPKKVSQLQGSLGGKRSGDKRRSRPWHKPVEEQAKLILETNHMISRFRLAEKLEGFLLESYSDTKYHVGIDTIKIYLSKLEKSGILRRRGKR